MTARAKTGRKTHTRGVSTEARRAEVEALYAALEEWQADKPEEILAEYLARFDGYHGKNPLLIAMQDEHATDVDARKAWIERGRIPIGKGSGIKITYPVVVAEDDADHPGQKKERVVDYRKLYVFDVRRTVPNTKEAREAWNADHPKNEEGERHWAEDDDYRIYDKFQGVTLS